MTTDRQDFDDHTPNGYVPGGYGGTGRSFRFADRVARVRFPVTKPQTPKHDNGVGLAIVIADQWLKILGQ
jgi:hypothetical protein